MHLKAYRDRTKSSTLGKVCARPPQLAASFISGWACDVRSWHKADMDECAANVSDWGKADMARCSPLTHRTSSATAIDDPAGSYQQSCKNISVRGDDLRAVVAR